MNKDILKMCRRAVYDFSREDGKDSYKGLFLSYIKMKYEIVDCIETVRRKKIRRMLKPSFLLSSV